MSSSGGGGFFRFLLFLLFLGGVLAAIWFFGFQSHPERVAQLKAALFPGARARPGPQKPNVAVGGTFHVAGERPAAAESDPAAAPWYRGYPPPPPVPTQPPVAPRD